MAKNVVKMCVNYANSGDRTATHARGIKRIPTIIWEIDNGIWNTQNSNENNSIAAAQKLNPISILAIVKNNLFEGKNRNNTATKKLMIIKPMWISQE